ncbi:hypothetical protein P2318_21540 [Myxococcaceae bacterium GXIMD 01537]
MHPFAPLRASAHVPASRRRVSAGVLLAVGLAALAACAGEETLDADGVDLAQGEGRLAVGDASSMVPTLGGIITNGIITNGIITNGIITNGLSLSGPLSNGLAVNGLGAAGLASAAFATWFSAYPEADADAAMRYVVACAVPDGERRVFRHPATDKVFTWVGTLGLTPGWARGRPASETEQQLVSGCLAALVNKYGMHVPVSMRARDGAGRTVELAPGEADAFPLREAAFFGNLFTGEGVFVCNDRFELNPAESTARACGLSSREEGDTACPPLVHVGRCNSACKADETRGFYARCRADGRAYVPVSTRLREQDVFRCGDGVCQFTESCDGSRAGVGRSYDSCLADCGRCASP